jgi:hypothetical protein
VPLESMILGFAQTVSGAVEPGKRPEHARIAEAARAELAHIERSDLEERRAAARRLSAYPNCVASGASPQSRRDMGHSG